MFLSLKSQLQLFLGLASKGCCQSSSVLSGSAVDSGQVSKLECAWGRGESHGDMTPRENRYLIKMHKINMQLDLSSLHWYFFSFNTLGNITLKSPLELLSILENGREWQGRKPHPSIHTLTILILYYSVFQKTKQMWRVVKCYYPRSQICMK